MATLHEAHIWIWRFPLSLLIFFIHTLRMRFNLIVSKDWVQGGDAVVLINFRADRMVEISKALEYEDFNSFSRKRFPKTNPYHLYTLPAVHTSFLDDLVRIIQGVWFSTSHGDEIKLLVAFILDIPQVAFTCL